MKQSNWFQSKVANIIFNEIFIVALTIRTQLGCCAISGGNGPTKILIKHTIIRHCERTLNKSGITPSTVRCLATVLQAYVNIQEIY